MPAEPTDTTRSPHGLTVMGWREHVALPEWRIRRIGAKADTGARSSAIDVVELEEGDDGTARFRVALSRRTRDKSVDVVAPIVRRARVRSAFGREQERLFVETTVVLGQVARRVEIGLVCRKRMICRMLLGRRTLADVFVVDAGQKYLLGPPRRDATTIGGTT